MKQFYKFDLQMIGEMAIIFESLEKSEDSIEKRNQLTAFANYCEMLQSRIASHMEAGQSNVLPSQV